MFKLVKKFRDQAIVKFHVLNRAGDVCGSINVSPNEVSELLRHWAGDSSKPPPSQKQNPFLAAMRNARPRAVNRQAILRSCL
jgi:hypothetical protein